MICKYCNSEISDGMNFCPNCGKKVEPEVEKFTGEIVDDGDNKAQTQSNYSSNVKQGFTAENIRETVSGINRNVAKGKNTYALISFILGVISITCCCTMNLSISLGVVAVILGVIAVRNKEDNIGFAYAGIACGALGLVMGFSVAFIGGVLSFLSDFSINGVKYFRW